MGYLSDISKAVSTDNEIIIVGTGVIIHTEKGIFMGKRRDNNCWEIPGGSLEINESLEECAAREVFEETNIRVSPDSLELNSAKVVTDKILKNGRLYNIVSISYIAHDMYLEDIEINSREFSRYGWFTREEIYELKDMITKYAMMALEIYFNRQGD